MVRIPECTSVYVLSGTPVARRPAPAGGVSHWAAAPRNLSRMDCGFAGAGLSSLLCFDLVPSCLPHTTTEKALAAKLTDSSKRFPLCLYLAPECSPQGVNSIMDVFSPLSLVHSS